jgi:hypothetical protein
MDISGGLPERGKFLEESERLVKLEKLVKFSDIDPLLS